MTAFLPPVLFLATALLMGISWWGFSLEHFTPYPYSILGLPLVLGGLGLAQAAKLTFRKQHANVNTFDDPDLLITDGMYRWTRNPMYIGMSIALLGFALLFQGSLLSFAFVLGFVILTDRWYIRFEEERLLEKFGTAYRVYCIGTRRWL